MQKKNKNKNLLQKFAQGTILSLLLVFSLLIYNKDELYSKMLLYETLPYLNIENDMKMLFKFNHDEPIEIDDKTIETFIETNDNTMDAIEVSNDIIGTYNVIFQDESINYENHINKEIITHDDIDKLRDIEYLSSKFYSKDGTLVTASDFNVDKFLSTDLKIDKNTSGPKILIFHTHINEMFVDSDPNNIEDGIYGVGEALAKELRDKYNVEVLHHDGVFDRVEGKSHNASYEVMEPAIQKILSENPSIEVVIDMHRDGIADETKKLVTDIDGRATAQIMYFNGLSKIYSNGNLRNLDSLPNPNLPTNLAFSFNMQLISNALYPNFTRKVYLKPYRYSLHMKPKSLLIEVGAQTNTMAEARNTAIPLANILAEVILGDN